MSMLAFIPWCRIDKVYEMDCVRILPVERHTPIDDLDDAGQCRVNAILATYKTIEGTPVNRCALVAYVDKSPIDDLNEDEISIIRDLIDIACFCGLSRREYFLPFPYSNSDCFALYFQKFDKADFSAITTRRREGQTSSSWSIDNISITIPVHCHTVEKVQLDEALLKALVNHRAISRDWAKWQNAITCFNEANTDNDNIRYQVEWTLLCSAFQHLLGANSNAKDVATRFSDAMVPNKSVLVHDACRKLDTWCANKPLRYEWMLEFYKIRGAFAHGKLNTQQPMNWSPLEHVVLATIAFPLVVRCLLTKDKQYALTDYDQAQIEAFEKLADTTDFLRPPADRKTSLDSHWSRLCEDCRLDLHIHRALEACQSKDAASRSD